MKKGAKEDNLGNLVNYSNIRNNIGNSWVTQFLNNKEYIGLDLNRKQLNVSFFESIIRNANPDVLKYMNEMDKFDFAEMVRGYCDLVNNNKFSTFEKTIKSADGFYGEFGWINYWKLTPSIKYALTTIQDLKAANKLLPIGNATDIQLASLQAFTSKGDFINIPMRYNKSFLGEYAENGYKNILECLDEFRKIDERIVKGEIVFSGKTISFDDFQKIFKNGINNEIEYVSFISTSKLESVAVGFADITQKWVKSNEKIAIIQRIFVKNGVYIDDISDWGKNLGKIRHPEVDLSIQIQQEILLNPGKLKQTSNPIPIMENGQQKMIDGMKAYYIDFIQVKN